MNPRLLLDTHIVVRWLYDPKRLSREQTRAIDSSASRQQRLGVAAVSLVEIAMLVRDGRLEVNTPIEDLLDSLDRSPFQVMPLTPAIALELVSLGALKDPFDSIIAATARVHGLRLVTSDQRIIASNLVSIVE